MNHNRNPVLSQDIIKEIARNLDGGATCYVNKSNHDITTIVGAEQRKSEEPEAAEARQESIAYMESKSDLYLKIEQMPSKEHLQMMRDFIEELRDPDLMRELTNALNRKKPMRNFVQVVGSDEALGQHWHNFKAEEYQRWVSNVIIDAYNY